MNGAGLCNHKLLSSASAALLRMKLFLPGKTTSRVPLVLFVSLALGGSSLLGLPRGCFGEPVSAPLETHTGIINQKANPA